ncbi:UDP-glycosyltransferase 90A1 [Vitis vinifera]|uniref:Glycosyltransferase n=1 Tax=Vitis vinifera TaxID=29760 RepID=A0A438JIH2_VITVI|nr:UDP-glycosyltransferase 90A1 [Vitis vinifera]
MGVKCGGAKHNCLFPKPPTLTPTSLLFKTLSPFVKWCKITRSKRSEQLAEEGEGEEGHQLIIMDYSSSTSYRPHMILFPFMSKGHTIPMLHLASLLLHRRIPVTFFTTPANRPFISQYLAGSEASIVELPFPEQVAGVPAAVESTDKLPSMSLFSHLLKPQSFSNPTSNYSALKFGIPRLVFYCISSYAMTLSRLVYVNGLLIGPESDDEPFSVPEFPWIRLTKNDFEPSFGETSGAQTDFFMETAKSTSESSGLVINSFCEIDSVFLDYWNRKFKDPKGWCIGPLCLVEPPRVELQPHEKPAWVEWLDLKLAQGNPVLYVAFGSQADISAEQLQEIATGLEESKANFLWVKRQKESEIGDGFEERVKDRGIVVKEWVDQRQILSHRSVQGFLSHCGWNSVLESICAAVPILAWPMMAEQHLNARNVVEEMKVGLRVETTDGSVRGFVKKEGLEKMVKELMEGDMGKQVREKVKEVAEAAKTAMEEGGSSWQTLNVLIGETCKKTSVGNDVV